MAVGYLHQLTPRQAEVAGLIASGRANKEIAQDLGLSEGTVKVYATEIFKKLGFRNRTQLAVWVAQSLRS